MTTRPLAVAGISAWHFRTLWCRILTRCANLSFRRVRKRVNGGRQVSNPLFFVPSVSPYDATWLPWRAITEILRWEFLINLFEKIQGIFLILWLELQTIYITYLLLWQYVADYWFQWMRGLRRGSAAVRLLELPVRIPPQTWASLCCEVDSLRRADRMSRGVLSSVVCLSVVMKPQ